MKCNVAREWIHEYLDDDLPREQQASLNEHLLSCPDCRTLFEQMQRTEAFAHAALTGGRRLASEGDNGYTPQASMALTDRIMQQLPSEKRRKQGWTQWIRRHPAVSVAAVFLFVMAASFMTMWEQDSELIVRGNDLQHIVFEGNTVIVPEGVQVNGDLTVENGVVDIHGEVKGNLTVIDGSVQLASTAKIIGENREINQALDWLWYKVTKTVSGLAN